MLKKFIKVSIISMATAMTLGCTSTYVDPPINQIQPTQVTQKPITVYEAVKKYSKQYNVDEKTIHAIIKTESNYNPNAKNKHSSATGLMQLTKVHRSKPGCSNLYDIEANVMCGTRHYRGLLDRYAGSEDHALAAYNLGGSKVKKGHPIPKSGQLYVTKVKKNKKTISLN